MTAAKKAALELIFIVRRIRIVAALDSSSRDKNRKPDGIPPLERPSSKQADAANGAMGGTSGAMNKVS